MVGGLVVAIGSLAFGVHPDPGTLTFFLGLAMIAGEFRPVARLLDRAEVGARKLGRRVGGTWRSSAAGLAACPGPSWYPGRPLRKEARTGEPALEDPFHGRHGRA